jgi:hypothetical protein
MKNLEDNILKEFDEKFDGTHTVTNWNFEECLCDPYGYKERKTCQEKIKSFLLTALTKVREDENQKVTEQYKQNPPYLDVSSWKNYGLKMGFFDYLQGKDLMQ